MWLALVGRIFFFIFGLGLDWQPDLGLSSEQSERYSSFERDSFFGAGHHSHYIISDSPCQVIYAETFFLFVRNPLDNVVGLW
jgi:hypothetical protein